MSNPSNVLGTPNALGGRTSTQGFSAGINGAFSAGITTGFRVRQNSPIGMSVLVGSDSGIADQAIVKDGNGNIFPILNNSQTPIVVTIPVANASNPRIDSIVIYRDTVKTSNYDDFDSPGLVGIIVASGSATSSPSIPTDSAIRTAITADGATGASAAYTIIANVRVNAGSTTIATSSITQQPKSGIGSSNIDFTTLGSAYAERTANLTFYSTDNAYKFATISYNVPDGVTKIKIESNAQDVQNATPNTITMSVRDNDTVIARSRWWVPAANNVNGMFVNKVLTVVPGSTHTITADIKNTSDTGTLNASATAPATLIITPVG